MFYHRSNTESVNYVYMIIVIVFLNYCMADGETLIPM